MSYDHARDGTFTHAPLDERPAIFVERVYESEFVQAEWRRRREALIRDLPEMLRKSLAALRAAITNEPLDHERR